MLGGLLTNPSASGIVVRHDSADAKHLELGTQFPAVARILPDGCGTLVAPTWVLTAAHVAATTPPTTGRVQFGEREYSITRIILHPEADVKPGRPPEIDLALIELNEPVEGVSPMALYRGTSEVGKTITLVGFGDIGDGKNTPRRSDGRRRAALNKVDDAGPKRIFFRFDEPPNGVELEGVSGPGDSGGPALVEENGVYHLAGVSSASKDGRPGRYGVIEVYMRVGRFIDWIIATIAGKNPPQNDR